MSRNTPLHNLMLEIDSALDDIDRSTHPLLAPSTIVGNENASSLLEQCEKVTKDEHAKPKLPIIHHFACSGGSLISKCLAAMPNVYLISEVHPYGQLHMQTQKPQYRPTDLISLSRYANVPDVEQLAGELMSSGIVQLYKHTSMRGGHLVLRDHTHIDFCTSTELVKNPTLLTVMSKEFDVLPFATVRHPIDSYSSLVKNGWVHFEPATFDEYCRRYLDFISSFKPSQIMKYETFVKRPIAEMRKMTSKLGLPFDESFVDTFSTFSVTGDSGRGGDTIAPRNRRPISAELEKEMSSSRYFGKLLKKLRYKAH